MTGAAGLEKAVWGILAELGDHGCSAPYGGREVAFKIVVEALKAERERTARRCAEIVHGELHGSCEEPDISVGEQSCDRCKDIISIEKEIRKEFLL